MKQKEFLAELRVLSVADLQTKAAGLAMEIMKLRFRKATGQLDSSHRLGVSRRNLARVKGELSARRSQSAQGAALGGNQAAEGPK